MSRKKGAATGTIRHSDANGRPSTPSAGDATPPADDQAMTAEASPQVTETTTGDRDQDEQGRPIWTAAEAARRCGVSRTTLTRRLLAGEIDGAHKDADGAWRVPLAGLLAAGMPPTDPRAEDHAGDDAEAPGESIAGDAEARIAAAEHAAEIAQLRAEITTERVRREAAEAIAAIQAERVAELRQALRMLEPPPQPEPEAPEPAAEPQPPAGEPEAEPPARGMGARFRAWLSGTP